MEEAYYCGFNGFRQVPSQHSRQTITTLIAHGTKPSREIADIAVCWNYLVVADEDDVVKYGMSNGKHGHCRVGLPPGEFKVVQMSATPRHLLAVTENGKCWEHEESMGWRQVKVCAQHCDIVAAEPATAASEDQARNLGVQDASRSESLRKSSSERTSREEMHGQAVEEASIHFIKTSCGDAQNLGLDSQGKAYALPSPLDFDPFPSSSSHRVTDVVCGKEHAMLLTEHGQVFSWGGGSRGQLGHGSLNSEDKPRLVMSLDGMRIKKIAAGGWHSACITQQDDLYMFGWNESGQLGQPANLVKPAECFSAFEKLFVACCTMQPEDDASLPRGDSEDGEVYHKGDDGQSEGARPGSEAANAGPGDQFHSSILTTCISAETFRNFPAEAFCPGDGRGREPSLLDSTLDKESLSACYSSGACNGDPADLVTVQALPMLVSLPTTSQDRIGANAASGRETQVSDVACGSRHTVLLTTSGQLWSFGWNKYGQLGLGHNHSRDAPEKLSLPKSLTGRSVKLLRCGDWGTAVVFRGKKA